MEKVKIGPGFRVGKLEVVEATKERKNGYTIWRCLCGCGNERLVDTRTLQRGTIRDCGCETKVPPGAVDLTGRRFGRLVVTEPTDQRGYSGSIVWKCRCDCGAEVLVPGRQLTSGYKKSCGCLSHPPLKDMVGKRFGQLTVESYGGKVGGQHLWKCRCDCGKATTVRQTYLQSGKTKSCGCLQASIIRENMRFVEGTSITVLEAVKNKRIRSNTSGHNGVYRSRQTGKWVAQITFKGKTYYLGSYEKIEDAVKARSRGEEMFDSFLEWYYTEHGAKRNRRA